MEKSRDKREKNLHIVRTWRETEEETYWLKEEEEKAEKNHKVHIICINIISVHLKSLHVKIVGGTLEISERVKLGFPNVLLV